VNPTTGVIARKAMPAGMIMKRVKLSSATMQTISDPNTPASPSPIIATYEDSTGAVISVNIVSRTANTSFTIHSATHVGSGYLNYAYPSQGIVLATGPQGPQGPQGVGSRDSTTASNGLTMIGKDVQLGGALTKATSVSGLSATNKMSFTGAGVDAFNVDGTTFSVDATNNRVGIGNALPEYTLDLKGSFRTVHSNFSLSTYGDGTNAIFGLSNSANFPPRIRTSQNSVINWDLNFGNNIDFTYYSAFPTGVSRFFVEGATGNVGIGTSTPNANAILDVSSSTKGMKLPSVSLSAANLPAPLTAHVAGMLVYNTAVAGATPNNVVQGIYINDGAQWILLQTPSQNATDVPVGSVFYRATSTVPTGYLACNGQAVSRTAYATLFATIGTSFGAGDGSTTFNVPDLRGQFVRGWDDGRGVDPGRVFGSWQVDALKSHTHTYSYSHTPNFNTQCSPNMGDGCFWLANNPQTSTPQTSATGGSETRPTNVAMSAIIKF
jgi:microcystin-dependent protein